MQWDAMRWKRADEKRLPMEKPCEQCLRCWNRRPIVDSRLVLPSPTENLESCLSFFAERRERLQAMRLEE